MVQMLPRAREGGSQCLKVVAHARLHSSIHHRLRMNTSFVALLALVLLACRADAQQGPCADAKTTIEIRQCFSVRLTQAEQQLAAVEDSVARVLDDPAKAAFQRTRGLWQEYRSQQCAAVSAVFGRGTMGPVAELDCLVAMTEQRRALIRGAYGSQLAR